MTAKFLLRLDDACHTMRQSAWAELEASLDQLGIKPLVGVVPENADPDLKIAPPSAVFWDMVRRWQAKGWTIGMHGYRHVFHPVARAKLLLPFYDKSEFAGLPLPDQASLIARSWAVFVRERIHPTVWIAPAHCFDTDTLNAIRQETPIRIVSDGLALDQFHAHGFDWLPQQLWALKPHSYGLWTICLHPSNMTSLAIRELGKQLTNPYFRDRVTSVNEIQLTRRSKSIPDRIFEHYFWTKGRVYQAIDRVRHSWRVVQ